MKACIINYTPFHERLVSTTATLRALSTSIDIETVNLFDKEDLHSSSEDNLNQIEQWSRSINIIAPVLLGNALYRGQRFPEPSLITPEIISGYQWLAPRVLQPGELSVILKHFYSISVIASSNCPYGLVVEDDVRLGSDSETAFSECCTAMDKKNFDYIDLAGGCGLMPTELEIEASESKRIIALANPRTRCTAAYLISKRLAKSIANNFFPLVFPIDWHLQYIFCRLHSFSYAWCNPEALIHGSEQNLVQSWRSS
jgi:GR25 family glycosyltransferase involved in LPS biosynthesis